MSPPLVLQPLMLGGVLQNAAFIFLCLFWIITCFSGPPKMVTVSFQFLFRFSEVLILFSQFSALFLDFNKHGNSPEITLDYFVK